MTESQRIAKLYARQHRLYVRRVRPLFLKALQEQIEPVLKWIESSDIPPPLDILINVAVFRTPLRQAYQMIGITAAKREYYYQRGEEQKGVIEFLVNAWRTVFNDYATNYAYDVENSLSETTKNLIREALQEGYDANLSGNQLSAYIRKKVQREISRSRATTIAVTETTTASNLGKEIGAKEYLKEIGQKGYKQWVGRADERERHSHYQLNDDIIPIDQDWLVGGEPAARPGDLRLSGKQRIWCRCSQIFLSERRYNRLMAANKK